MIETPNLEGRIEAILFVTGEPVAVEDLARALGISLVQAAEALQRLAERYDEAVSGFTLRRFGKMAQLASRPVYADDIVHMLQPVQKQSLSQAVMETLAVIAYRQPVTKAEVEQVRGVKCDYSVQVLTNRGLIRSVGRKETLGRPMLYATTDAFLEHFGIESLNDLPPMPTGETEAPPEAEGELVP